MITGVRSETGWGSKVKTSAVIRVWSFDEQQHLVWEAGRPMVQTEKGGSTSDPGNPGHMTDKCSVTLAVCHTVAV